MAKKISDITTIAGGLAILYATSFLVYLQYFRIQALQPESAVLLILFGLLFISAIAVVLYKIYFLSRMWIRLLNGCRLIL